MFAKEKKKVEYEKIKNEVEKILGNKVFVDIYKSKKKLVIFTLPSMWYLSKMNNIERLELALAQYEKGQGQVTEIKIGKQKWRALIIRGPALDF